jgi:hypothetical protein
MSSAMSARTIMSQSVKIDHPSKPERYGVRKRENEKSVDWLGSRGRHIRSPSCRRLRGVIDTGIEARLWMLWQSTL